MRPSKFQPSSIVTRLSRLRCFRAGVFWPKWRSPWQLASPAAGWPWSAATLLSTSSHSASIGSGGTERAPLPTSDVRQRTYFALIRSTTGSRALRSWWRWVGHCGRRFRLRASRAGDPGLRVVDHDLWGGARDPTDKAAELVRGPIMKQSPHQRRIRPSCQQHRHPGVRMTAKRLPDQLLRCRTQPAVRAHNHLQPGAMLEAIPVILQPRRPMLGPTRNALQSGRQHGGILRIAPLGYPRGRPSPRRRSLDV